MLVFNQRKKNESVRELSLSTEQESLEQTMLDIACRAPISVQLATLCIAFVLAWMARDSFSFHFLSLWFVALITVSAIRFWALRYWIPSLTHLTAARKLELSGYFILPVSIMFGSSGMFFESYRPSERAVQVFMLYGLIAVSIATLSGARRPMLAVAIPIIGGITLGLLYDSFLNGHLTTIFMSLLSLCFFFIVMRFARLYHDLFFVESYNRQKELRELNGQLQSAYEQVKAASDSKNLFFASASHDLRQPIHTLSLLVSALSLRQMDDKAKDILGKVDSAMQNLSVQMDSMLDIAKLDAGVLDTNIQRFNCSELLNNLVDEYDQLAKEKRLVLKSVFPNRDVIVCSDKILLDRLLRNLLSNAIKYTEQGEVIIKADCDDKLLNISVIDTGIGIGDSHKKKVFDEFYQVANPERDRSKGLGLGLSIVKRLSELLDIDFNFESTLGAGSQFHLKIPLATKSYEITSEPDVSEVIDRPSFDPRGKTLLCIDDQEDVLNATALALSELGYGVIAVTKTKVALEKIARKTPDAMLVDFRLADGDDGLAAIRMVRALYPGLPAILVSGDTSPERLREAADAGVPLLNKPVSVEQIEICLNSVFAD